MAGRRRSSARGVLLPVVVLLVFAAVIALVYSMRVADMEALPGPAAGGSGTLEDLPVQVLSTSGAGGPSGPGAAGGSTGESAPGDLVGPSPQPSSTGSPGEGSAVGDSGAAVPPVSGPSVAVPAPSGGAQSAVLWLDGWSALLAGSGQFQVRDVVSGAELSVVFSPLSADQVRSAARRDPEVVASYLARLMSSSSDVRCDADGSCWVDGQEVDPGVLASPGDLPGVGQVYRAAGVRYGLLAARLASDSGSLVVTAPSGTTVYLDGSVPADGEPGSVPSVRTGFNEGSWALAYGLGRVFLNDPAWIGQDPVQYRASARLGLSGVQEDWSLEAAPVLVTSVADAEAASWAALLSDSEMTYLTSPASGCGSIVFCSPVPVQATVSDFRSSAAVSCLKSEGVSDSSKALLLGQVLRVSVELPKPVIMLGLGERLDSVLELDVTRQAPVSGKVSFSQQGVFVVTDDGIVTTAGRRNLPALSLASPELFSGSLGPCAR